ncbi:hypothetical protein RJP68_23945, partial [Escherichia coli]|nr:hypothetical protein [Escherichia coli]
MKSTGSNSTMARSFLIRIVFYAGSFLPVIAAMAQTPPVPPTPRGAVNFAIAVHGGAGPESGPKDLVRLAAQQAG